ncbi:uncharacterized protein LOC105214959 isoform X2 [Zeugodacus cucurbitae]|uniref:ERI1 exoribonuclease 2 n=1 Tax=Zeugodacus cucurbitae TaxID=28588 RepID=A0A0A1WZ90_ZEUCU|nr:uncharacterized protein LOC105214959 isoform X2 [Zeugodacus cucurbitae]
MQRSLNQRELQALDLRTCNMNVGPQQRQQQTHKKYSTMAKQKPGNPHATVFQQLPLPPTQPLTVEKHNSSSEQSMNQGLTRSMSMIDLPSRRGILLRLRGGCEHMTAEEEELKRFCESVDPNIVFDELQPEPPLPTQRQTARLCAGSPTNYSCPPPTPCPCPNNFSKQTEHSSRIQNYSSFCPPGLNTSVRSTSYPQQSRGRSSFDEYPSIPPRRQSAVDPTMSFWSPPMPQPTPTRHPTRASTSTRYSQDTSKVLYESPRRSHYSPTNRMNSTPYMGLPGQPFNVTRAPPQMMTTKWMTPPGRMPSAFMQQSTLNESMLPTMHETWTPPSCPREIDESTVCPETDECPNKNKNLPCEGCENSENSEKTYPPPPRCKPLHPDITKKLCGDLPPFKIPRSMEDDFICIKRREQWEQLVRDQNCPGAIQSTIDGSVDFNALAFNIFFGEQRLPDCLPRIEPITLLEAFFIRVNYERCQIKKLEELAYARDHSTEEGEHTTPPPSDDCTLIEKCFKRKYATDLNAALEKLFKAEKGFSYLSPQSEQPLMSLTLESTSTDLPGIPISIKAYTGTTKPRE